MAAMRMMRPRIPPKTPPTIAPAEGPLELCVTPEESMAEGVELGAWLRLAPSDTSLVIRVDVWGRRSTEVEVDEVIELIAAEVLDKMVDGLIEEVELAVVVVWELALIGTVVFSFVVSGSVTTK